MVVENHVRANEPKNHERVVTACSSTHNTNTVLRWSVHLGLVRRETLVQSRPYRSRTHRCRTTLKHISQEFIVAAVTRYHCHGSNPGRRKRRKTQHDVRSLLGRHARAGTRLLLPSVKSQWLGWQTSNRKGLKRASICLGGIVHSSIRLRLSELAKSKRGTGCDQPCIAYPRPISLLHSPSRRFPGLIVANDCNCVF